MRVIGAASVILSAVFMTGTWVRALKGRLDCLEQICLALERIEGDMALGGTPMPQLCEKLAEELTGQLKAFFRELAGAVDQLGRKRFAELWSAAANRNLEILKAEEREEWLRFGAVLGQYPLQQQLSALKACQQFMAASLRQARIQYPETKKLGLALSGAAAACLLIVLL